MAASLKPPCLGNPFDLHHSAYSAISGLQTAAVRLARLAGRICSRCRQRDVSPKRDSVPTHAVVGEKSRAILPQQIQDELDREPLSNTETLCGRVAVNRRTFSNCAKAVGSRRRSSRRCATT